MDKEQAGLHSWAFLVVCGSGVEAAEDLFASPAGSDEELGDAVKPGKLICRQDTYSPYK